MNDRNDYYYGGQLKRRGPRIGRFLAPLFLIAVIGGTYLIVHHGVQAITDGSSSTATHSAPVHHGLSKSQKKYAKVTFYVVQPGDTLSAISAKTGVRLVKLKHLNPKLTPNALQLGERIRLRR